MTYTEEKGRNGDVLSQNEKGPVTFPPCREGSGLKKTVTSKVLGSAVAEIMETVIVAVLAVKTYVIRGENAVTVVLPPLRGVHNVSCLFFAASTVANVEAIVVTIPVSALAIANVLQARVSFHAGLYARRLKSINEVRLNFRTQGQEVTIGLVEKGYAQNSQADFIVRGVRLFIEDVVVLSALPSAVAPSIIVV